MVSLATFVFALFFTQATRALPQAVSDGASGTPASSSSPTNSWTPANTTYYTSTPSPNWSSSYTVTNNHTSLPYTTTPYWSTPSPYSSSYNTTTYHSSTPTPYSPSSTYYPSPPPYTPSSSPNPPTSTPLPPNPNASPVRVTYDAAYDNKNSSLNSVACSNGANGLAARFPTFGDVPSFPFIGGAFDVVWNSPNCGGCWNLTNPATGATINITAIDAAAAGFNIAQEAFEKLTGGDISKGAVDVVANKVSPSVCGL